MGRRENVIEVGPHITGKMHEMFDDLIEHWQGDEKPVVTDSNLKFRAFETEADGIVTIAYIDGKSFAIWGPWNGDDEDSYWETCSHCIPMLADFREYKV